MFRRMGLLLLALLTGCAAGTSPSTAFNNPGNGSGSGGSGGTGTTTPPSDPSYVYVSTGSSSANQITGYSVGSDGSLTAIAGSPFATKGGTALFLAGTGNTLFGADGYSIYSFGVGAQGGLTQESKLAAGQEENGEPVGGPVQLFFDSSQANLYSFYLNLDGPDSSGYGAYSFSNSGKVAQTNTAGGSTENTAMLAFTAKDHYAYTSSSFRGDPAITEYKRTGNGALTQVNENISFLSPTAPAGAGYLPYGAAADGSNHVIIAMGQTTEDSFAPNGPWQLAVYTASNSGKLTTASTYQNMTTVDVGNNVTWYAFSPDDKYLAVSGAAGVQVFAWNATNGTFTAVGTTKNSGVSFDTVAWDASDHLYALSILSNSLYAYAVSGSTVTAVSGSPYSVQTPQWMAVLSQN